MCKYASYRAGDIIEFTLSRTIHFQCGATYDVDPKRGVYEGHKYMANGSYGDFILYLAPHRCPSCGDLISGYFDPCEDYLFELPAGVLDLSELTLCPLDAAGKSG